MSDICDMWSLPWHALQKNLASGKGAEAAAHPAVTLRAVNMQIGAVAADSWLGRARLRTARISQARQ
jgi:hypothetical protein